MKTKTRPILCDLLAIALLCALVIGCFWKIALAGRVLAGGDIFSYFYPYWAEATRAIRAGRLPLWNPYLFMGAPFLANSQVGIFYPLNWPLWLLFPAHQSVHLTLVLHLCLAALNSYLWARASLRLGRFGAWTVGATFALGGYLGAQVEHVNQLQGLAWLPLMLMLYDASVQVRKFASVRVGKLASLQVGKFAWMALALVVGLMLLAGHTQTAFISLVGLGVYGLGPVLWRGARRREWGELIRRTLILAAAVGLGVALAAVQLAPTWELARLSVRAEGLPFNERVSFSLTPLYLARALLPGFAEAVPPEHIEHVAYVGVAGLALAAIALLDFKPRASNRQAPILLLLCLALFLSLGFYNPLYLLLARFVPGFAHFRVPARWLTLYALGMAALAGWGVDALWLRSQHSRQGWVNWRVLASFGCALVVLMVWAVVGVRIGDGMQVAGSTVTGWAVGLVLALSLLWVAARTPRLAVMGLLALLIVELFAAGSALPHGRATASQAFTSLRPAIAHLLSAEAQSGQAFRFISMSDITFDPGDLAEIDVIYGSQLSAGARYDYVIAAKRKEVLSLALPLVFGVPAVDGYDGGVLPLTRYITLQRSFLSEDEISMDGRLRENLTAIPDGRWLNLFNVRHVITDKLYDAWLDDIFYDLQFGAQLEIGETAAVARAPRFEATALGIVSYLRGGAALPDGTVVGVVEIGFGDGLTRTFELRAGEHTAEGLYGPDVAHAQAQIGGHFWPGEPLGNDYVTRLRWQEPSAPVKIVVRARLPEGELIVRGVSLIDERTGGFCALVLSDRGRFRLAHSGDVKIYENLDVLPRAFLVREGGAVTVADDEGALRLMQDPAFDPAAVVVLAGDANTGRAGIESWGSAGSARVAVNAPERVEIELDAQEAGYLVLTDAWYPGWEATVDGEPATVRRADLLFRAVAVDAGSHRIVFTFRPASVRIGAGVSLAGLAALAVIAVWGWQRCPKRGAML